MWYHRKSTAKSPAIVGVALEGLAVAGFNTVVDLALDGPDIANDLGFLGSTKKRRSWALNGEL